MVEEGAVAVHLDEVDIGGGVEHGYVDAVPASIASITIVAKPRTVRIMRTSESSMASPHGAGFYTKSLRPKMLLHGESHAT